MSKKTQPLCVWCKEVILPEERIENMPLVQTHRECVIRSIFGSIAHIRHECSCYGGNKTDEDLLPGLTRREHARLAFVEFSKNPPKPSESPMRERAKMRPQNFEQLSGQEQWDIDKSLGILDWDGD
jgi:hypothetical protein